MFRISVKTRRSGPTVFAEASVVPGAVFDFGLWIDVQEGTFFVATLSWRRQRQRMVIYASERSR